ncbi:hypothetical protein ACF3NG_05955 [Aerococcaceae bacterium WGS1372]
MNFIAWIWIIYFVGSFILTFFTRKKVTDKKKSKFTPKTDTNNNKQIQTYKAQLNHRDSKIRKNNEHVKQRRKNHQAKLNNQRKMKDSALNDLKNTLISVIESKPMISKDNNFDEIADYDVSDGERYQQFSGEFADSSESFEAELKKAEINLNKLDKLYSDSSIEDTSWMGLDDEEILLEDPSSELLGNRHNKKHPIQKVFADKDTLRNYLIFNEVMSKPKGIRR